MNSIYGAVVLIILSHSPEWKDEIVSKITLVDPNWTTMAICENEVDKAALVVMRVLNQKYLDDGMIGPLIWDWKGKCGLMKMDIEV